jgi:DNA-binding MarR family transcriptional regulator
VPVRRQPTGAGGASRPASVLVGDAALGAIIDAVSFSRAALGAERDPYRAQREVLLALAYSGEATRADVARALRRESTTVRDGLRKLRERGLAIERKTTGPARRAARWYLTPAGAAEARVEANRALRESCFEEGVHALLASPRPSLGRGRGGPIVSAVRVPVAVNGSTQRARAAERLAAIRKHAGWTQAQLASRAGLPLMEVQRLENGRDRQAFETMLACCQALGVRLVDVADRPQGTR